MFISLWVEICNASSLDSIAELLLFTRWHQCSENDMSVEVFAV